MEETDIGKEHRKGEGVRRKLNLKSRRNKQIVGDKKSGTLDFNNV